MQKPTTYREALHRASSLLEQNQLNPKIAEWLMLHAAQIERREWLEKLNDIISVSLLDIYISWIRRVIEGEPYQYITEVEEFYGREFHVNSAVLIPRPETELLVEHVLAYRQEVWPALQQDQQIKGVDVGTGSGVIAISLALEDPKLEMLAVDLSESALEVAQKNADRWRAQVQFLPSDLLTSLQQAQEKVDVIVSNPPYIPYRDKATLARNVVDFEPHLALFADQEGLSCYRQIVEQSRDILRRPGLIAFEIGQGQDEAVVQLIHSVYPEAICQVKEDYNRIKRMVFAIVR